MILDVVEQVALVSGRLLHRGTGEPIEGRIEVLARQGAVVTKVLENGDFAVSADPQVLLPLLASQALQLDLEIVAQSAYFRTGEVRHRLAVNVAQAFPFNSPIPVGTLLLPVDPAAIQANIAITLSGRVARADDPATPIGGATVEVLRAGAPVAATNTSNVGLYRIPDQVVEAPAQIRCSAAQFIPQTRQLLVDFSKAAQDESFRLVHV